MPDEKEPEQIPFMQKLLDSPWILLGLGMVVMFLFYTIWGMYEIMSLPQATLP